jgi:CRISPR-associated protein Cmr6
MRDLLGTLDRDVRRHPGLMLDRFLRPCANQEMQRETLMVVAGLHGDPDLLREHHERRGETLRALRATVWSRTTQGPLTLHLARASALENAGICLHPIYGFTYLPGTGLKGMARSYAETVWCPTQPDPVKAWGQIEAVFGWAPRSDVIDGQPKPWKPRGIPKHADAEAAACGMVVFHDAWPETWPQLEVDIVNNHHAEYYQGDRPEPPGDWSSPVPVTFLGLRAGTVFRFALSPRRPDVPAEVVSLAENWLDSALTRLGCGAKTAAGYGRFQADGARNAGPLPPTRAEAFAELELVTPGFFAGADHQDKQGCDLRPATLRGLLRWWWRTLHAGFVDVRTLRDLEGALWGDTRTGAAIHLHLQRLTPLQAALYDYKDGFEPRRDFKQRHGLSHRPDRRTTQGLFYASYGMDEQTRDGRRQRFYVEPGCRWRVGLEARDLRWKASPGQPEVVVPAAAVLEQARLALQLLCGLGGVGSKARKGFGSLVWHGGDPEKWSICLESAADFRWRWFGSSAAFSPNLAGSPALAEALDRRVEVATPWTDCWQALDHVGFAYQAFAQHYKHDRAKVSLGLPRKIHGPGDREPMRDQDPASWQPAEWLDCSKRSRKEKVQQGRHASPVHIHLSRSAGNTFTVHVLAFPAPFLPDRNQSVSFLDEFLRFFEANLEERARIPGRSSSGGPSGVAPPSRPLSSRRPEGTRVQVKVLGRHEKGGPAAYFVQEQGKPRGILNGRKAPAEPPADGATLDVYLSSDDPRSPMYSWDPPTPPPRRPGGRR